MIQTLKLNDQNSITVYWYKAAKSKIYELAKKYKDDVESVSKGGKNRNKRLYYKYPCSFDIETTTIRSGEFGYFNADDRPLGVPYLFQFNIYGTVIMCRYIKHAMRIFYLISKAFCYDNRTLVFFDHNLGYEYGFFKDYWDLDKERCFAIDIHHPVTLWLKNKLLIKDSYKLTNMSLATLSNDWSDEYLKAPDIMDYKAKRMPWTPLDEFTILYAALDVLSLSDSIQNFLRSRGAFPWTNIPTSTGFIRALYKNTAGVGVKNRSKEQKNYRTLLEDSKITLPIYELLQRQARGGNTHNNRKYTGIAIQGVGHMDIVSSYPTQMVCYPEYPLGSWASIDPGAKISDIMYLHDHGYCLVFDCTLINPRIKDKIPVPYIPMSKALTIKGYSEYSDNGRYLTGAEMLSITLFSIEWPIIAAQYDFDDVIITEGYYARKGYLPDLLRRFILDLYAKKTELKNVAGSEIEYQLAKTYVNGIFGMAFTRILRDKCRFDDKGIFEVPEENPAETLEKFQKSSSYFLCYAWGSMTSTLGRVYLQKLIDCCGWEDFLYCDTDSVFYKNYGIITPKIRALEKDLINFHRQCGYNLVYYDKKNKPHELGSIDEEARCTFKSFGAKKYVTVTEKDGLICTIAGVPKKAGSKIIKNINNFKLGMVFKGVDTNKLCLWYNDDEGIVLHDSGHYLRVKSNIAMLPCDYLLGIGLDYRTCLHVEGVNDLFSFVINDINMNEEDI